MEQNATGKTVNNIKSVTELSEEDWQIAKSRYDIIEPIISGKINGLTVTEIANQNGVNRATIYRWIKKYERTGNVSSLVNEVNVGPQGKKKLPEDVETIIKAVIEERYLTQQKLTVKKISLEIAAQCKGAGLKQPSYKAIRQRINSIRVEEKLHRRYHRSIAMNKFKPLEGSFPGANYPLAVVQIDHTPIDLIVVDDVYREPVGKPWITMAIDVYSRMIIGFYISLDAPGALGTGLYWQTVFSQRYCHDGKWMRNTCDC